MDDAPTPFQPQVSLTPEEDLLEQNTREGLRALFHWAVFPFPLAVIPLGWGSQLPVFGFLFGGAAFAVLAVWAIRARAAWGGKIGPAWNAFRDWLERFETFRVMRQARAAKAESKTAQRAVSMDTPEGDIQVSRQRDAWTTQIARLEGIFNRDGAQELLLRQLRRNVADLDKAEALRHATPAALGNVRMASLGAVGRPQGFLGALPVPGFSFPFSWALAAVLAVTNLGTFWLWNGARSERDQAIEAAEQMAASNQRLTEALGDASQAHTVDTQRRIEQVRNEMEAIALEREREARRAALRRERNALENDPSLGPIDFGQRLPNLVEPASADGGGDGEPASPDPVGDVPG